MHLVGLSLSPLVALLSAGAAELSASTSLSTDGVYQLRWSASEDAALEEASEPGFDDARTLYEGPDRARLVSGRGDGIRYYRLTRDERTVSEPVSVEVEHHDLARALLTFAIGAFVFGATAVLVLSRPDGGAGADG